MAECHCGKDGHALHSINCPVHGLDAQIESAAMRLYYAVAGHRKEMWTDLPKAKHAFWIEAAKECLAGAETVRG